MRSLEAMHVCATARDESIVRYNNCLLHFHTMCDRSVAAYEYL